MTLSEKERQLLEEAEEIGRHLPHPGGESVDRDLLLALADAGLLRRLYSEAGVSAIELCLIRQGLARVNTAAETAFAVQGLGSYPIYLAASPELRERWIPAVAAGEAVAAFALSEPGAGSDAANLALAAERDGDGWRLQGEKAWISHAPDADVYVVFARTSANAGARGISAFVVPGDSPGLSGERVRLVSPHPIGNLTFDGVPVPADNLLGEVDQGFRVAMSTLDLFRPSVGALAVGMSEAALAIALDHAEQREAFGRPIVEFQAVSHLLAEMATRTTAARLLVYEAARAYDRGDTAVLTGLAAMAKLTATENAQFVVDSAIQILGARGLEESHPLAHLYRDVRAPRIYEGTSEIQRQVIVRELRRSRAD